MMAAVRILLCLLFLLSSLTASSAQDVAAEEAAALIAVKSSFQNPGVLPSWSTGSTPCGAPRPWEGVVCFNGQVSGLRLGSMGLSGTIDVDNLSKLRGLRTVSLNDNSFAGGIPDFTKLQALKSIYVSNNRLSGPIPDGFFAKMVHMKKLWISGNSFEGSIPSSLSKLTLLMELHLEDNQFSGAIPEVNLPSLKSFNASNNKLEGPVPPSLGRFGLAAFRGNVGLCGPPMDTPCGTSPVADVVEKPKVEDSSSGGNSVAVIVVIAVLLVLLVSVAAVVKRNREAEFQTLGVENRGNYTAEVEVEVPAESSTGKRNQQQQQAAASKGGSAHGRKGEGGRKGSVEELVIVNDEKGVFGLPDLMKAAAEVLGNGGLGSAYKALMATGTSVVVKRMKEMNRLTKDVFDMEMRKLGRLRHANVLTPLGYHYRKEEKLLVFEYIEKGSLLYILHGDRGPYHAALDWSTRLKIICGIARGMGYLHAELSSIELPHGNLKSGNVLLGRDFDPLIMDYGYTPLVNPSQASQVMFAYRSPEYVNNRHVSAKSDVYCLGVLILELLTGKFPSQYLNNGKGGTDVIQWVTTAIAERREAEVVDPEIAAAAKAYVGGMERMLRLGVALTEVNPEKRPDMKEALAKIEEIAANPERVDEPPLIPIASIRGAPAADTTGGAAGMVIAVDQQQRPADDNFELAIS